MTNPHLIQIWEDLRKIWEAIDAVLEGSCEKEDTDEGIVRLPALRNLRAAREDLYEKGYRWAG